MNKFMKTFLNELLYFTYATFLTFCLFAGYEMIFVHGRFIDIMFGVVVIAYPIGVISKDIKMYVKFHIDNMYRYIKTANQK